MTLYWSCYSNHVEHHLEKVFEDVYDSICVKKDTCGAEWLNGWKARVDEGKPGDGEVGEEYFVQ